jgi:diaminohydroxyphosphoribosylaminopyrimidine deaminase / 5-amino-6-(5-phosphoribosylamino)uracil reductase
MNDSDYMKHAIRLAKKGTIEVSPNPRVGCLVVKHGKIIAEGYHSRRGGPHAERVALTGLDSFLTRRSTLIVTLEPCDHFGKTPPCTRAIISAGISRVIIGCLDPNPIVHGRGVRRLRKAGIKVRTGVLEGECRRLNEAFFKFIRTRTPFITVKVAQTLDGKIATRNGDSKWISHEKSRHVVHRLRRDTDAVLVGVQTVIRDDPELTVRDGRGRRAGALSPKRIVLDSRLRIPDDARLLKLDDPERTILAATAGAPAARRERLEAMGVRVWTLRRDRKGRVSVRDLLKKMAEDEITSVLVEGGADVFTSFMKSGEVDRLVVFTSPKLFGDGRPPLGDLGVRSPENAFRFERTEWKRVGPDMMFIGEKPCSPASLKR